jgi:hypothetical protein
MLTFNLVLERGNTVAMTMDPEDTLNDLKRKLKDERGARLLEITVGGATFKVAEEGDRRLVDLGVTKQCKVLCKKQ